MIPVRSSYERLEQVGDLSLFYLVQFLSIETVEKLTQINEQIKEKALQGVMQCRRFHNYTKLEELSKYSVYSQYQKAIKHLDIQKLLELQAQNYKTVIRIIQNFELVSVSIGYDHGCSTYLLANIMDNLVNLQYLQIEAKQPTIDSDDVYKYFLYNKNSIKQLKTHNIQFIHDYNQYDQYFDRPTKIKQLVTQILNPIIGLSTISTAYFNNLQYLYLQIQADLSQMMLKHDNLTTIKIESIQQKQMFKCFVFDCPKLERFLVMSDNLVIEKQQFLYLLQNCIKLQKCQVVINCTFHEDIIKCQKNKSLRELQITQFNIYKYQHNINNDRLLSNYDAVKISEFCSKLQILSIQNIFNPVTDCDVLQIILNNQNLVKLQLSNLLEVKRRATKYFQRIDKQNAKRKIELANLVYNYQKEEMIKQNMIINQNINQNTQQYFEVDYLQQYPFKLKTLMLQNVLVTDQLFKQLFLLNINYQLEELWLENLNITDATIYIMLTGSEMREQDENNANMKQNCQNLNSQFGNIQQIYDIAQYVNNNQQARRKRDSLQQNMIQLSKTQKFDCYVNDFIDDEKQTYQLSKLSIINCENVTQRITYALMYTSDRMRFIQLDFAICPLFMAHINQNRNIMVSIQGGANIDELVYANVFQADGHLYLFSNKSEQLIQFSDLRSQQDSKI